MVVEPEVVVEDCWFGSVVVDEVVVTLRGCVPGNAGKSLLLIVNSLVSDVGAFTIPTIIVNHN